MVCYGLLDSHAMFSSMSSLRLDNFVYTEQGIAAAWKRVRDDGILSVSFSVFAGDWMRQRMLGIVKKATGLDPIVLEHGYGLPGASAVAFSNRIPTTHPTAVLQRFCRFTLLRPAIRRRTTGWLATTTASASMKQPSPNGRSTRGW